MMFTQPPLCDISWFSRCGGLFCADGTVMSGRIEPDGTYAISPAPAGPTKVAVRSTEEAMPALITVDPSERAPAKGAGASTTGRGHRS